MKVTFDFPVYRKECDTCKNRFKCLTIREHREFDVTHGGSHYVMARPFFFGLACFEVKPRKCISHISLNVLPDGMSMVMDLSVDWM